MKKNFDHLIPAARNYFPSGLKLLLCSLMLLLMQTFVFAQETKTITGKVSSASGEPLPGATIAIRNSAVKTSTDEAGNFRIAAPSDAVLEITFVGYDLQEVSVAGRDN